MAVSGALQVLAGQRRTAKGWKVVVGFQRIPRTAIVGPDTAIVKMMMMMMMISLAPWLSQTPGLEPMCKGKVPRWTVCRDGMWGKVEGTAWMESGRGVFMKKYWSRSLCKFQSAGKLIFESCSQLVKYFWTAINPTYIPKLRCRVSYM